MSPAAVERSQKVLHFITAHVDIIVSAHEPLKVIQQIVIHILQHHERFFLRRIRVIHARQSDQREIGIGTSGSITRKERNLT